MIADIPSPTSGKKAATLIELLTSMAILSVLLSVLAATLQASLGQFRSSIDHSQSSGSSQQAIYWLKRDLQLAVNAIPANLPSWNVETSPAQKEFFEGQTFFPFEVNRKSGRNAPGNSGFPARNAAFATLAFPSLSGAERVPNSRLGIVTRNPSLSIIGYYVAYSPDSPISDDSDSSMKLFRHFRPSGNPGDGYADGFLRYCHREINDSLFNPVTRSQTPLDAANHAAIRQANFGNSALPFLLSARLLSTSPTEDQVHSGTPPWPEFSPPPEPFSSGLGTEQRWSDPSSAVHDIVFPDEAVAMNVVRFEITPFRIMKDADGLTRAMGSSEVTETLNLGPDTEWPCLVSPTFLEIVLGVIDEKLAKRLKSEDDWIVDWTDGATPRNEIEALLINSAQIQRFRVAIREQL